MPDKDPVPTVPIEKLVSDLYAKFPEGLKILDTDKFLKWEAIVPHEARVRKLHGQTLDRLAERGGLGSDEVWSILIGKDVQEVRRLMANMIGSSDLQKIDTALLERLVKEGVIA